MTRSEEFKAKANNILRELNIKIRGLEYLLHNNDIFLNNYLKVRREELLKDKNINSNFIAHDIEDEDSAIFVSINEYEDISSDSREILSQYLIVACYSFYEKSLKEIILLSGINGNRNLYKADEIANTLRKKSMNISNTNEYSHIEELRHLNNAIKHSGTVSKQLSKSNSLWIENTKIQDVTTSFISLAKHPEKNLKSIINMIAANI